MDKQRRQFICNTTAGAIALALAARAASVKAADGYVLIDPPQNTSDDMTVEVMEFFWLGCPHCYALEPSIAAWKADIPDNVIFVREAPPINSAWEQHSRSFYAAQLMGKETDFVNAMFVAIHEKGKRMRGAEEIAELAQGIGLDKARFLNTMKSFGVQTRLNRSLQLARSAGISGVPTIVINGKYRTGARLAGGNAAIIDVINRTVAMEKQAMGLD